MNKKSKRSPIDRVRHRNSLGSSNYTRLPISVEVNPQDYLSLSHTIDTIEQPSMRDIGKAQDKIQTKSILKQRFSNSANAVGAAIAEDPVAKKEVEKFVRKNRVEYPKQAKQLHEILSAPDIPHDPKIKLKSVGQETAEGAAKKVGKSLLDKAVDMKILPMALGVGVTTWLVNKLSDSRGQQSNAQLYGQQGY